MRTLRMVAGLYQVMKDIASDKQETFSKADINALIGRAVRF
jgi:hypothetical protein